jgi:ClpP class serine protease
VDLTEICCFSFPLSQPAIFHSILSWLPFIPIILSQTHVSSAREGKLSKERESDLFSGDIWLGKEALELGLIDGLGDLRSVCRAEFGDDVKLVKINVGPPLPWPFGGFQTAASAVMGSASASGDSTQRVTDALADSVVDVIDDRAAWARYKTH